MVAETLSNEKDNLDLGYDIDFKKELEKKQNKSLNSIYGKLKLLDKPPQHPKDHSSVQKLSLNVTVK